MLKVENSFLNFLNKTTKFFVVIIQSMGGTFALVAKISELGIFL